MVPVREHALFAMVVLAGCGRFGFDDSGRGLGDDAGPIDVAPDAMTCEPGAREDFPRWTMPNFTAGMPNTASYTTGSDTVRDNVSGLIWQRVPPPNMSQTAAAAYCEGLTLDGACDWRLPQRIELISIADYTHYDPTITTSMFPGTASIPYWSATPDRNSPQRAWYVSFLNGLIDTTLRTDSYGVRCVRGGGSQPASHYTSTVDTVLDNGTDLIWERTVDVGSFDYAQAMARCAALTTAGGGWRSPSINELETLVDVTVVSPAIHSLTFPQTPSSLFWSRNVQVADASQGWTVNFDNGTVARSLTTALPVRCVR
jgi:hypothetical protein